MNRAKLFGLIAGLTFVCGCGGGEAEHAEVPKTPVTPVVNNNVDGPAPVESVEVVNNEPNSFVESESVDGGPPASDFKNPFFSPPPEDIEIVEDVPEEIESSGEVQLLGFVNVTQPKAIIKVAGKIHIAVEGTSYDQVTVVKIDESSVVLKRKGREWKVALFDRPSPSAVVQTRQPDGRNNPFSSGNSNPGAAPSPGGSGLPNIPGLPGGGGNGGFPDLPGLGDIPGALKGLFGG
jgi:hypothetical protein